MANQTVYPYGTGGSLPSSIGVINDFTTGGATNALSAEAGKTFHQEFESSMMYELPLDKYAPVQAYPNSLGKWRVNNSTYPYFGLFIPCSPSKKYELTKNGNSSIKYCFLQSDAHVNNTDVQYATGYSGEPVTYSGESPLAVTSPANANFLYVVSTLDAGDTIILPSKIRTQTTSVGDAINDVVGNDCEIPDGTPKRLYTCKPFVAEEKHYVSLKKVAQIDSIAYQGGASYGNYLILFTAYAYSGTYCYIYNLATSSLVQAIEIPSDQRGFVSNCHSNTVNIGTTKYDADDPFPLVYVSTGYWANGYTGALVYRIIATTENDTTTYSLSLVQTLKMPGETWTEFCVGESGFCYLCYTDSRVIYKMALPPVSQGDQTFDLSQAKHVYNFSLQPASFYGSRNQSRFYYNGKIYLVSGVPSNPKTATSERSLFFALDLATETRESIIDIQDFGINSEPETCFIWNGKMCISFARNTNVYALLFD